MSATQSWLGPGGREVPVYQVGSGPAIRPAHRREHPPPAADPSQALRSHQTSDTLAADSGALLGHSDDQEAVKADFWNLFDIPDEIEPGDAAEAQARGLAEGFRETWNARYPGAVACLLDDLDLLLARLAFPRAHWVRIRHTNLIERTFGESRRRVKVMGRLPGERSCLSLVWAALERASAGWRGITYTPADVRRLQSLRHPPQPLQEIPVETQEAAIA